MGKSENIVTIDGPAASGKTTVSRELARRLGWNWVSTGAFYRAIAYVAKTKKADTSKGGAIAHLIDTSNWKVTLGEDVTEVWADDEDVTHEIYLETTGNVASQISQFPEVRERLLAAQRACADGVPGLVAEGRDCGTVVFPEAPCKIYLTADSSDRARRRAEEEGKNLEETQKEQKKRDKQDSERTTAPLQAAAGAHIIDTTKMTREQVIDHVEKLVRECMNIPD